MSLVGEKGEKREKKTINHSYPYPFLFILYFASHPRSARTPPSALSGRGFRGTPSRFLPFALAAGCAWRGILVCEGGVALPLLSSSSLGGGSDAPHSSAFGPFGGGGDVGPPRTPRARSASFLSRLPHGVFFHCTQVVVPPPRN